MSLSDDHQGWESVIGLEVHVQIKTRSKLFSSAPNRFGEAPNTNIGVVDVAHPGTLPKVNREAVDKAVRFGCAIQAKIPSVCKFDRKSYFYPDLPRNFQITQLDQPIIVGGTIFADVGGTMKAFQVDRAHLEDDAGMLKHFPDFTGVDFNRAGVPLLEIVSQPCMSSAKEATAYAMALKNMMEYLGVSNCNMEEGSLRVDVNVSVRRKGEKTLRNKVEIKNLNSFHWMEVGINAEIRRQIQLYLAHSREDPKLIVPSVTVRLDIEKGETVVMRSKEEAKDYRFCPDPDLPLLIFSEEYLAQKQRELPELPHQRFKRYREDLQLTPYHASLLVQNVRLSDYFETALREYPNGRALCNWITVEFVGRVKERGGFLPDFGVRSEHIAQLVSLIDQKKLTGKMAKSVADLMVETPGKGPLEILVESPHFQALYDHASVEPLVDEVINQNPQSVRDFKEGKEKSFHFLIGQVMKSSKGKAAPDVVHELLRKKLS